MLDFKVLAEGCGNASAGIIYHRSQQGYKEILYLLLQAGATYSDYDTMSNSNRKFGKVVNKHDVIVGLFGLGLTRLTNLGPLFPQFLKQQKTLVEDTLWKTLDCNCLPDL